MSIILSTTWASVTAALARYTTIGISRSREAAQFLLNIRDCCRLGGDIEELNCHTEPEPNLVFGTLGLKMLASCFLPSQRHLNFAQDQRGVNESFGIWRVISSFLQKYKKCFMM